MVIHGFFGRAIYPSLRRCLAIRERFCFTALAILSSVKAQRISARTAIEKRMNGPPSALPLFGSRVILSSRSRYFLASRAKVTASSRVGVKCCNGYSDSLSKPLSTFASISRATNDCRKRTPSEKSCSPWAGRCTPSSSKTWIKLAFSCHPEKSWRSRYSASVE